MSTTELPSKDNFRKCVLSKIETVIDNGDNIAPTIKTQFKVTFYESWYYWWDTKYDRTFNGFSEAINCIKHNFDYKDPNNTFDVRIDKLSHIQQNILGVILEARSKSIDQ